MFFKLLSCCIKRKCDKCNSTSFDDVEDLAARDCKLKIFEMNDFVFGEEVRRGTFSHVRLLVRVADKVKFAGKFLQHASWGSLINEASIMSKLSGLCANISSVEGIMVKWKCLILPYYRNGDLGTALTRDDQKVKNGSASEFPFLKRLKYIWEACKAVSFLHRSSICHRDLAMRNLLLSDDMEHVLLTDFTLSRYVAGMNSSCVTYSPTVPVLSAPEIFSASSDEGLGGWQYSLKTDSWGLGITMFEIITKRNFESMHCKQKMPTKLPQSYLPPRHLFNKGWDLWCTIRCCWNIELKKRPWSWEVMDRVKKIMENPAGGKIGNLYYERYPTTRSDSHIESTSVKCVSRFSIKEFLMQTTSDMEFSECVTDIRRHSSIEIIRNPNKNLTPKTEGRKVSFARADSSRSFFPWSYFESWNSDRVRPSSNTAVLKLNLEDSYSNVTNIAYCKDRHFFGDKKMINQQELSSNLHLQNQTRYNEAKDIAFSGDNRFFDAKSMAYQINQQEPSSNLHPQIETSSSEVIDIAYSGDNHFFDAKSMAHQPKLFTSDCEIFDDSQLSDCSPVTDGIVNICDEILEETQGSIHSKRISEPRVRASNGVSILL